MIYKKPTASGSSTNVQASTTNGKLKVNGTDISVYDDTQVRSLITSNGSDPSYMKYNGKKVISLGDSITQSVGATNNYPTHLATKLNATVTNLGSSGADHNRLRCIACGGTSNGGITYTAPDYSTVDAVTLTIGHNGGVGSSTIADISGITDFNLYPDTYYGNVCRSIEYILSQNQNIRIYLLTPIQSLNASYINNTAAATTAIKVIGAKYALPVIDLQNTSGLHFRNINLFTGDGTHPNPAGAQKIAEVVFRQMLSY